jgi:hypothetical protein
MKIFGIASYVHVAIIEASCLEPTSSQFSPSLLKHFSLAPSSAFE